MNDWQRTLLRAALPLTLLLVALTLAFWHVGRPEYLIYVWTPWARVGAVALVMTAIIISGGIDLSVGSTMALSGVLVGVLWRDLGCPIEVAAAAAVGAGLLAGVANGALVLLGISPLVATLATMALYRGLAMSVTQAENIRNLPDRLVSLNRLTAIPNEYWLLLIVFLLAYAGQHHTGWGRCCFALGDNERAARYAAIPVKRIRFLLYALSGLVAGLMGIAATIEAEAASPDGHRGAELQAIACVVVGGTSITGGRGGMMRTLLGVVIISQLDEGLKSLSFSVSSLTAETRLIVMGGLVISVAVWNEWLARDTVSR